MNDKTKLGFGVLEAALLLGVLGDALLRATPWGLNVFLWTCAFVAAVAALLARWRPRLLKSEGGLLIATAILFAAAFAWRDSLTLKTLDALALLAVFSLASLRARAVRIRLAGVMDYVLGAIKAGLDTAFGFFPLVLKDIRWKEVPQKGWSKHAMAIMRGLIIAVPLLLVFGALFMAADAVFEGLINNTFHLDGELLLGHIFLTLFFTWTAAGFLRGMLLNRERLASTSGQQTFISLGLAGSDDAPAEQINAPSGSYKSPVACSEENATLDGKQASGDAVDDVSREAKENSRPATKRISLGIVEIGVALGLVDALFLGFVIIQVRYFFGGAALVQATTGLTYAEYARRGFFELVTVAALVLPLLLFAHWLLRKENPVHERIFRALAGGQIILLFVIMASAVGRMRLYQFEYGLTELRLYTTAFMCWLALVFVWFALTVLRNQRERFACGALVAGFLMITALHLINPDALIVRVNVNQAQAGRSFDANYAASLSADAVPALASAWPAMSVERRCVVARSFLENWSQSESADWRTWNWSRSRARRVVRENAGALRGLQCQPVAASADYAPGD